MGIVDCFIKIAMTDQSSIKVAKTITFELGARPMSSVRWLFSKWSLVGFATLSLSAFAAGCGQNVDDGFFSSGGSGPSGATATGTGTAGVGGSNIEIHLRASTAPFAHDDGLAGQTPVAHSSAIRSLQLFKDASDTSPLTVFDFGANAVEAGYNDGDDTLIDTVPAKTLPKQTYTIARVTHNYVRYSVKATAHYAGLNAPGQFDNIQVLSDGSNVDGVMHDHGYFDFKFTTAGMTFPLTGDNAPVPEWSGAGGFAVKFENGEWAYYFPVVLPIDPDITSDIKVVLDVNMNESFRWQDQTMPDYTTGVFDTTATTFEPVLRFGANSFALTIE
jgi:hypothetical protein